MFTGLPKALILFACAVFLAFGFWQVRLLEGQTAPPTLPVEPETFNSSPLPAEEAPGVATAEPASVAPQAAPGWIWKNLEAEDYPQYVGNLRAIGCPDTTIKDIVAADLVATFSPHRQAALAERYRDWKYWKSDPGDQAARRALEKRRREIDGEMGWAMRELLGGDYLPPSTSQNWRTAELDLLLNFLPDGKREPVRNLLIEYSETGRSMKALALAQPHDESLVGLPGIIEDYEQKREQLRATLTEEEFHRVELTTSWVADDLRRRLSACDPTESEFQAVFNDWQDYAETLARIHSAGEQDDGSLAAWMRNTVKYRLGEQRARQFWLPP